MILDAIRSKLSADAVFDGTTWKCYIGYVPPEETAMVLLLSEYSAQPDRTQEGELQEGYFQVYIRAGQLGFSTAESKWQDVMDSLHNVAEGESGSPDPLAGFSLIISEQSRPTVFLDEANHAVATVNFHFVYEP